MSYDSFTRIAPHYDALMRTVPYKMWISYFQLLCAQAEHEPTRILDVCCGTGTVCELLHEHGYQMTGFDKSAPMIEAARQKAVLRDYDISYSAQDIADLTLDQWFDTAVSFFDSLNYVTDPNQLREGFHKVARCLEPGALFIFDLNTEFAFANEMFDQQCLRKGADVRYRWKSKYDKVSRICTVTMEFWVGDEEFVETHIQRAHSNEEIRQWLSEAGFHRVRWLNSYTLDRPTSRSDRVHYLAEKA